MTGHEKLYEKMDALDPIEFLSLYAGGEPLAKPLVQLVYELKQNYSFTDGVINAIFEICLRKNNYKIVRSYILGLAEEMHQARAANAQEVFQYMQEEELESAMESPVDDWESDFNHEYVETNIALIARQLHELRKEVNDKFKRIHQRLDQIEYRLEQLNHRLRS